MDDAQWAKIEAKRERNRYFEGLVRAAADAAHRKPKKAPSGASKPRKPPKPRSKEPKAPRTPYVRPPYVRKPRDQWKPRSGRPKTVAEKCVRCERPFRPRRTTIGQYPGTVYHAGHNHCRTCENYRVK